MPLDFPWFIAELRLRQMELCQLSEIMELTGNEIGSRFNGTFIALER
jgi:hypothetical protein